MAFPFMLIAAVAATQAVQSGPADAPRHPAGRAFFSQRAGRPFMSPMGEPFFGRTPDEDGLTVWFEQTDRNHDGSLTADEMVEDAQRFFLTLDTNHDGEIDPDEITHYEDVIAPEVRIGPIPPPESQAAGNQQEGGQGGGGRRGGGGRGHRGRGGGGSGFGGEFGGGNDEAGAGRYGLLQIPEPVISADADFNRGVSADEFGKAAIERFQLLDVSHTGRLTLSQLEAIRQAAVSAARHPVTTESSPDDQPIPGGDEPPP